MKLYYAPGTCALACWISLEWAGADYEAIKANPRSEEYKKVNPLGMVPALDIGGARAMTQNDAILQYIAERFADKNLGSDDGIEARFEFHETMAFLTGDFHPAFWPIFVPERFTTATDTAALEAVKQAANARIDRVMSHLDALIGTSGHVYRGKKSVADAYAFVMAEWSVKAAKSWKEYAHLAAFMQAMQKDKSVAYVMTESRK